jgi:hypothetical protein
VVVQVGFICSTATCVECSPLGALLCKVVRARALELGSIRGSIRG